MRAGAGKPLETSGKARRNSTPREPGDLPAFQTRPPDSRAVVTEVDMTTKSQTRAGSQSGQRIATGLFALFLGAFFIFGAGFAHSQALHDTAHDVRHAFGFPCH